LYAVVKFFDSEVLSPANYQVFFRHFCILSSPSFFFCFIYYHFSLLCVFALALAVLEMEYNITPAASPVTADFVSALKFNF
jgi:hypothetical protein